MSVESDPSVAEIVERLKNGLRDGFDQVGEREALERRCIEAMEYAAGDADWVNPERLLATIELPSEETNDAIRFYFNLLAAGSSRAFDVARWQELAERPRARVPDDGALVVFGFDGSKTRDHTALIGTEVATGYQWVAGYWEPMLQTDGQIEVNVKAVDAVVRDAFERWEVWRLNADPFWWLEQVDSWAGRYGATKVVSYNTTRQRVMSVDLFNYRNAITAGTLSHDGDPRFERAIANAVKVPKTWRVAEDEFAWLIKKEAVDSELKIDATMAGCLSHAAYSAAVASGVLDAEPKEASITWAGR